MEYNPNTQEKPYMTIRTTLSNESLLRAATKYELDTGKDIDEIIKDLLVEELEREGYIELNTQ